MRSRTHCLKWVGLAVVHVALSFALAEGFLRAYQYSFYKKPIFIEYTRWATPFLGSGMPFYQLSPKKIRTHYGENFELEKPPGTFRVVVFGGSNIENPSLFQTHHKSLTGLLANRYPSSGIEFINVAFAGYTTAHSLVLLNLHVQSWNPDLLVIAHNFNDLTTMYYPNYAVDYSHFLNLPYFQKSQYTHPLARVLSQFRLTQSLVQKLRNPVHFSNETKIPFEAGAQVYRRNLESFLAIAHKEKVPVVILSEPIREDREAFIKVMSHQPYAESATFPPFEQILEHHRAFNKIALSYAGRTQVFGLDTAKRFAGHADWFSDFIHPSEKGIEVLASSLGDFLDDTKLLPGAKPLRTVQLR